LRSLRFTLEFGSDVSADIDATLLVPVCPGFRGDTPLGVCLRLLLLLLLLLLLIAQGEVQSVIALDTSAGAAAAMLPAAKQNTQPPSSGQQNPAPSQRQWLARALAGCCLQFASASTHSDRWPATVLLASFFVTVNTLI